MCRLLAAERKNNMEQTIERPEDYQGDDNSLPVVMQNQEHFLELAETAHKRVQAMQKMFSAAFTITTQHDWIKMGNTLYLQASGCEKVARLFGVTWEIIDEKREDGKDDKGQYTIFRKRIKAYLSKDITQSVTAMGTGSTRDIFFSRAHGKDIPYSEISMTNVEKKAETNAINRALKKLLGISGIHVDDIPVDIQKNMSKIQYGGDEQSEDGDGDVDNSLVDEMLDVANQICALKKVDPKDGVGQLIQKASAFKTQKGATVKGETDPARLTLKRQEITLDRLYKWLEDAEKQAPKATETKAESDDTPKQAEEVKPATTKDKLDKIWDCITDKKLQRSMGCTSATEVMTDLELPAYKDLEKSQDEGEVNKAFETVMKAWNAIQ